MKKSVCKKSLRQKSKVTRKRALELIPFDVTRYLTSEKKIAQYLDAILEIGEPALVVKALGDIARVRGMAKVAIDSGLGRESLYKALSPKSKPRFETIMKVAHALGVQFTARVA